MAGNTQTYVHKVNDLPVAASEAVPGSGLATALGGKADKVTGGTAGDLVALDSTGNLVDAQVDLGHLVKDVVLAKSNSGDSPESLVDQNRVAVLPETTEAEILSIINAL